MRYVLICAMALAVLALPAGCPPTLESIDADDAETAVAGASESALNPAEPASAQGLPLSYRISGSLSGAGDYELFDLGAARVGEEWSVSRPISLFGSGTFLVVLLDADYTLLRRVRVSTGSRLEHVIRADIPALYVGVAPAGGSGGEFDFTVRQRVNVDVPGPAPQVVYLNFDGAGDLSVHSQRGISFAPFDADMLGPSYAGATDLVKAAIVDVIREDYAAYNVLLVSSDEGPPPEGAYSTVHFGAYDSRLLGLADSVDQYNADQTQNAIVFVESFEDFEVMGLDEEEMAQMVGNVASHELGHLLGLFHTKVPEDIMDTTGTAWDLAANQAFAGGELEDSVFPIGYEDPHQRLLETVGENPSAGKEALAERLVSSKMLDRARLRALTELQLRCRCGNCLDPD
jgi:hypothetical protein